MHLVDMTTATTNTADLIISTARVCAQGWAEQAREGSARTWTGVVPDADIDFVERERVGRALSHEEMVEFCDTFRSEYAACMEQKADQNGWV